MINQNVPQQADLRKAIADLQARQRDLKLDFSSQITELQRRLDEGAQVSQTGSGAAVTRGGIAAGAGGTAVGRDVGGHVIVTGDSANIVIPVLA